MPIGPLMIEHRLIERMSTLINRRGFVIDQSAGPDLRFIDATVDFFKTYADRCHHGKEEDILFRDLAGKTLSKEHAKIMQELIQEHIFGRKTVGKLVAAKDQYVHGKKEALETITAVLKELVEFYPKHIEKEDKHFFLPCMDYFTKKEQDAMLAAFREFDRKLIHEKYNKLVEEFEK